MLPFTKRTARSEESPELIQTGDIEFVKSPSARREVAFPPPASDRPRVFSQSVSDEDMTTLLPRKGMTFSARPPAAVAPQPMPTRSPSSSPKPMLQEPPTRQFVKPSSPPPSISPVAGPPRASNRAPAPPAAPPSERAVLAGQHARSALKPQPVPMIAPERKSDPRLDVPATVITARTRIVAARPTVSWAAALVAMGVFVGLVTAVVARGDADTLIDAAASFVDPSGGHAAASGSMVSSVQTKARETHMNVVSTSDTLMATEGGADSAKLAWDAQSASPLPPRPAVVAYAAPVHHTHAAVHVAKAAPEPKEAKDGKDAKDDRVASAPKKAAEPKAAPVAKPAKANDDDVESASAADALAKAQLEASLR